MFNKEIKYLDSVMAFFASLCVPYAFSCFIRLNSFSEVNPMFTRWEETFLVGLGFACSWVTDSFAFLVGRKIGKHKMCPSISPKKSWEGFFGGIVFAVGFAMAAGYMMEGNVYAWGGLGAVVALAGVAGDLVESMIKREFDVKDSGNLIPGHGGVLDRFDALLMAMPFAYIYMIILGL